MEFRQIQTFQAIIATGSFIKAAEQMGYAQPTVTLHIQQLEAEFGVKLFARRGKRVELTQAGHELREQADHLVRRMTLLRQTLHDFAAGDGGFLRLGAGEPAASTCLTALLAQFCAVHPKVRLSVEVGSMPHIGPRIAEGSLDLGIGSLPSATLGLHFEPLFRESISVFLPVGHHLAHQPALSIADLAQERILVTNRTCAYRQEAERAMLQRGFTLEGGIEISSQEMVKRAVSLGMGLALLPASAHDARDDAIVVRPIHDMALELSIGLVYRTAPQEMGKPFAAFADFLRATLPVSGAEKSV